MPHKAAPRRRFVRYATSSLICSSYSSYARSARSRIAPAQRCLRRQGAGTRSCDAHRWRVPNASHCTVTQQKIVALSPAIESYWRVARRNVRRRDFVYRTIAVMPTALTELGLAAHRCKLSLMFVAANNMTPTLIAKLKCLHPRVERERRGGDRAVYCDATEGGRGGRCRNRGRKRQRPPLLGKPQPFSTSAHTVRFYECPP